MIDDLLDDQNEETVETEEMSESEMTPQDEGWNEYILDLLRDNEVVEIKNRKCPRSDGLRRIVDKLYTIQHITVTYIDPPSEQNRYTATVTVSVGTEKQGVCTGTAEAGESNTDFPFCLHPAATAETKAAGRAYKNLLRLVGVHTSEEMASVSEEKGAVYKKIATAQVATINLKCRTKKLDPDELVKSAYGEKKTLDMLSEDEAIALIEVLNEMK